MPRYKATCVRACFFQKQYWPVGKEYSGSKKPCSHFDIFEPKPKPEDEVEEKEEEEVEDDSVRLDKQSAATVGGSSNSGSNRSNASS